MPCIYWWSVNQHTKALIFTFTSCCVKELKIHESDDDDVEHALRSLKWLQLWIEFSETWEQKWRSQLSVHTLSNFARTLRWWKGAKHNYAFLSVPLRYKNEWRSSFLFRTYCSICPDQTTSVNIYQTFVPSLLLTIGIFTIIFKSTILLGSGIINAVHIVGITWCSFLVLVIKFIFKRRRCITWGSELTSWLNYEYELKIMHNELLYV